MFSRGTFIVVGFIGLSVIAAGQPPTVTVSLTPMTIILGQSASLSWAAAGATSCIASGVASGTASTYIGGWNGPEPTSGTQTVGAARRITASRRNVRLRGDLHWQRRQRERVGHTDGDKPRQHHYVNRGRNGSARGCDAIALGRRHLAARQHAGENLRDVLQHRAVELARPIQMCDAPSRNTPKLTAGAEILLANCLAHLRRQFVAVAANFPGPYRYVLETLGDSL
jgi:hypothetical protein